MNENNREPGRQQRVEELLERVQQLELNEARQRERRPLHRHRTGDQQRWQQLDQGTREPNRNYPQHHNRRIRDIRQHGGDVQRDLQDGARRPLHRQHAGDQERPQQYHRGNEEQNRNGPQHNNRRNRDFPRHGADIQFNQERRPQGGQYKHLGFKFIENMIQKNVNELVVELQREKAQQPFKEYLSTDLSPDVMVLICQMMAKICSADMLECKTMVLIMISSTKFLKNLTVYLLKLVLQTPREKQFNKVFWNDPEKFWNDLYYICKSLTDLIPQKSFDSIFGIVQALQISVFPQLETNSPISPNIRSNFKALQEKLLAIAEEREKKQTLPNKGVNTYDYQEPPSDFRNLSLYPTAEEITGNERVFLRKNIVEGGFRDVEHYLDIQFRLLREDFVSPLRSGVYEYLNPNMDGRKRLSSVRIHRKIQFIGPKQTKGKVGTLLKFDFGQEKHKVKVKFEQTRRFMFGSLLCFTRNNFASVVFATIVERDVEMLEKGEFVVEIVDNAQVQFKVDYLMVECEVYFEPYYHVMKALQMMDETIFPMSKYIVDVIPQANHPSYLTEHSQYNIGGYPSRVLSRYSWPDHQKLQLDETQMEAFHAAITHEFAVIQGPPGTGKTYIGLKIVRTLLQNPDTWNRGNQPILIVCFTNHALDQFLEGLIPTTNKIIRIGGQSKNEKLKPFHLNEQRRNFNTSREMRNVQALTREKHFQLKNMMSEMQKLTRDLDYIYSFEGIISFEKFENLNLGYKDSWFAKATDEDIVNWLLGGRTVEARNIEQEMVLQNLNQQPLRENFQIDGSDDEDDNIPFFDVQDVIDEDEYGIMGKNIQFSEKKLIISCIELKSDIKNCTEKLKQLQSEPEDQTGMKYLTIYELQDRILRNQEKLDYLQFRLKECSESIKSNKQLPSIERYNLQNPSHLSPFQRWTVYQIWLVAYQSQLEQTLEQLHKEYKQLYREFEEVQQIEDQQIMENMLVIGMTTTGAARKQTLLRALRCPIIVVEEAAEVLESHIVVSMTNSCKHLILIGDHKQLKPNTADFNLVKKGFKFNISLFERMVQNGIHCSVLGVQHRMRPEVASLIVPTIYPKLENHLSVLQYPNIKGVDKNLYFLSHTNFEKITEDSSTKKNLFEVQILIELAKYLVLQGYEPEEITILTTYTGQMFALWQQRKKYVLLKNVKITVVDNFQGEENKIILLSLVRSNEQNNIGFLGIENRVCVALSRAREGLFIIGNMHSLTSASKIWVEINKSLEKLDAVGSAIPLRCQIHPNNQTRISKVSDFDKVAEGGCNALCGAPLDCGHICHSLCHIMDREHKETKCFEKCPKILCEENHLCPGKCYEKCEPCRVIMQRSLGCKHIVALECHIDVDIYQCMVNVKTCLPCEHEELKPCYADPETFVCMHPCDTRLECGHQCAYSCHIRNDPGHLKYECRKECPKFRIGCTASPEKHRCPNRCFEECAPCEVVIKKKRTVCPHVFEVPCNVDVDKQVCEKPCKKRLPCGHACKKKCNEPCGDCNVKVEKPASGCGHKMKVLCKEEALKSNCNKKCPLSLACGHPCTKQCKEKCTEKCEVLVENLTTAACGHTFKKPCHLNTNPSATNSNQLLKYCQKPCNTILKCGHKCSGTCGKCYQGRLHQSCQEKCDAPLICGHPCEVPCRQICRPCTKPCNYSCQHSKCKLKCGQPCPPCQEPCPRVCKHICCTRKCGELCNVLPCTKPCPRRIRKCGHPCVGFCGDPCPKLCRICDQEELTEVFFGNENEPDAIFVSLDCGHCFESQDLDRWLGQKLEERKEINTKRCPRCNTPVIKTLRYENYVKETFIDIAKVKVKFFGDKTENEAKQQELLVKVRTLQAANGFLSRASERWFVLIEKLKDELRPLIKKRFKNVLNAVEVDNLNAQVEVVESIADIFKDCKLSLTESLGAVEYANVLLERICKQNNRITLQERHDFEVELLRLRRIVQLVTIQCTSGFNSVKNRTDIKSKYDFVQAQVYSIQGYQKEKDDILKQTLKELNQLVNGGLMISEDERKMIVSAMGAVGVRPGQWYKCPNGHPYVITECGGAMQMFKCPDCDAPIGGQNHRLLGSNAVATEMAGARYGAWSEQANMNNYNFD